MQALILAGGKGTRLRPYTTVLPKPLMPIGEMPILEIILRQLAGFGFDSVILAVNYMSHMFQSFFGDGEKVGIPIVYSFEDKSLGTAGPIGKAIDLLEENFLVMNGDLLTTLNFKKFYEKHVSSEAAGTIAVHQRTVNIDYGVVEFGGDGRLRAYYEKPSKNISVSMGINMLNKSLVRPLINPDEYLDIPDLMLNLSKLAPVKCFKEDCDWLDIGRIDDYSKATKVFEENRSKYLQDK